MTAKLVDYEKLGAFYLGKIFDHKEKKTKEEILLYDSKDLTTHAVCVGMTGSGKTGLCISLLEEAAIDGIPAIAIDPKGDLGNLMLTFPSLSASEFKPWIDPAEASRKGQTVEESAQATAQQWKDGLAQWGQGPKRIQKLRDAVDVSIYTPGSSAGRPLTVLRSFAPPSKEIVEDVDAFRDQVSSAASGLLALLDIKVDSLRSREHVLVSTLLQNAWANGKTLDLPDLIHSIQSPPFERIGVLTLEQFYPAKDRAKLAMNINSLLASPSFAGWLEGESLDIQKLLWTDTGKPKISILNIAHLSESERMFFVTILLNEMVTWMRGQSGTSCLRALLYMDEVFGFFPPVANPPSKKPMLTLLKQARAHGLGVMLATQNPVDLDYKGLGNTGTWFIGRMQTERDVDRIVDGLEGAATSSGSVFDRRKMQALIAGLDSRVFVLNNVHEDAPVSFKTRWALSYLRGPLTREHIKRLTPREKNTKDATDSRRTLTLPISAAEQSIVNTLSLQNRTNSRPALDPDIDEYFCAQSPTFEHSILEPTIMGVADLHFVLAKKDIDEWKHVYVRSEFYEETKQSPWNHAEISLSAPRLKNEVLEGGRFNELPAYAMDAKNYTVWAKKLKTYLYKNCTLTLFKCSKLKLTSTIGETELEFRVRVRELVREKRDMQVEKLRGRFAKKLARLQGQILRAGETLDIQESQLTHAKSNTAISAGTTLLGALFGRKLRSMGNVGRAGSTIRRASKIRKEAADVGKAEEKLSDLQIRLDALEEQFQHSLEKTAELISLDEYVITEKVLHPRRADIDVSKVALLWRQEKKEI